MSGHGLAFAACNSDQRWMNQQAGDEDGRAVGLMSAAGSASSPRDAFSPKIPTSRVATR